MKVQDTTEQLLTKIDYSKVQFELPNLIQEEGIIKSIEAYRQNPFKTVLYVLFCICTGGLGYLFVRWELSLRLSIRFTKCSLKNATHLLIKSQMDELELVPIEYRQATISNITALHKIFTYRLYTYYLLEDVFKPIQTNFTFLSNKDIIDNYCNGVQDATQVEQEYGKNNTTIPDKSTLRILVDEILSPFYIFQVFSMVLWSIEGYYAYAVVIFLTSFISVIVTLREAIQNFHKLRQMTDQQTQESIFRGNNQIKYDKDLKQLIVLESVQQNKQRVSSKDILPGELIDVQDGWIVPCDCILLNGTCIINESMLTGESIPIIKSAIPYNDVIYAPLEDSKQYTLFAGTKCIEARHPMKGKVPILAMASQTGFSTIKGQLVRSILFPKPSTFSFYRDSLMFIGVLAFMSIIGFLATLKYQIEEYQEGNIMIGEIIVNSLDLVTITVPPALPTCLSIGVACALSRLQKKKIFCISPNRVNVAGKITIMCFDKTGTLTEDGLDLYGVRPVGYSERKQKLCFMDLILNFKDLQSTVGIKEYVDSNQVIYQHTNLQPKDLLGEIMACCHGLAMVNNELIGDPLEVKMFQATKWVLNDIDNVITFGDETISIIKRFEFSSTLQRMSVVVSRDGKMRAHVKGSPEKLRELCTKSSIPNSFHKILDFYAQMGFRVLACGSKVLNNECSREQVECDLTFMGFMVMENKLKPTTRKVIETLQDACIRTIMVTGDNILTAISVARQCHLVQPKQRIFLGDIAENSGRNQIVWKDFEMNDNVLHPDNLSPAQDVKDDPDLDSMTNVHHGDRATLEIIMEDNINRNIDARVSQNHRSKAMSYKEQEKQLQMENLDHLIDDQDPWKTDEPFVIAMSGKAFQLLIDQIEYNPKARRVFGIMLERASIFARMKPDQKALLVQHLQKISRKALCGMCGDGANDCGALKAADVGISLSDAEASIAAPFTSKVQDISCVVKLLREGRAALVTSFQCFKFMALYSMIQFCTVTLLYLEISNLSDYQFLYIDLFIIIPVAATMGQTKAYKQLTQFQPGSHLISFPVLMSVIGSTVIQVTFQFILYYTLTQQKWYRSSTDIHDHKGDITDHYALEYCYENTSLFLYVNFQYIISCIAFSIGKPFRQPFYTNITFTCWIGFLVVFNIYFLLFFKWPAEIPLKIFHLFYEYTPFESEMPSQWLYMLLGLVGINMIVSVSFEKYVVPKITRYYRAKKRLIVKRYRYPENPYLQIE